jgi:membrane protein implicated in regulation of membrane protease activity
MSAWIPWLLVGVSLLIAEMVLPGAFLMWLGLAAFGTGLLTLAVDLRFEIQVIAFGVLTAISLAVGLRMRRRHVSLNTHQSGLVGRTATALAFHGREGRVRVGDSDWAARLPDDVAEPASGTALRVAEVQGTVLIVRPEG